MMGLMFVQLIMDEVLASWRCHDGREKVVEVEVIVLNW